MISGVLTCDNPMDFVVIIPPKRTPDQVNRRNVTKLWALVDPRSFVVQFQNKLVKTQ